MQMVVQPFQKNTYTTLQIVLLYCIISGCLSLASSNEQTTSPAKYITKPYFEKFDSFRDSEFDNFLMNNITHRLHEVLKYTYATVYIQNRKIVGEGSHRHLSTSIELEIQDDLKSELAKKSCTVVIIERLPSGVFADPFELQHLVHRGEFADAAVFGDTNLELPSFRSNQSVLEIHVNIASKVISKVAGDFEINLKVPLHARYQPLGVDFSKVEFEHPDIYICCGTDEEGLNGRCMFTPESSGYKGFLPVIWEIPCGKKEHAEIVSALTFASAIVASLFVVVTAIYYSGSTVSESKHS